MRASHAPGNGQRLVASLLVLVTQRASNTRYPHLQAKKKRNPARRQIPLSSYATNLLSFKDSDFNTDLIHAEWGTKQALSRLPRPRFLTRSLDGPVVQGHLKLAAERLGYRWTQRAGEAAVKLVTERE